MKRGSQLLCSTYHPGSTFQNFGLSLGLVPTSPSFLAGLMWNPRKSHGLGLLTLIKLLPSSQTSPVKALLKMGSTPGGLISLAPSALCKPDLWWLKPLEKESEEKGGNTVLHNVHQLNSLKSCSQVSRTRLKWQGGGCSDMYPGGALMVTDNLLCRGCNWTRWPQNWKPSAPSQREGSGHRAFFIPPIVADK